MILLKQEMSTCSPFPRHSLSPHLGLLARLASQGPGMATFPASASPGGSSQVQGQEHPYPPVCSLRRWGGFVLLTSVVRQHFLSQNDGLSEVLPLTFP